MKRICSYLLMLASVALLCSTLATAQRENRSIGENRVEAKRAAKQQQKVNKKLAKQHTKAMKKYQKSLRKSAKQQKRRYK
jgi:F0F1-type ATP synthase membrane subunit b/b'